MEPSPVHIDFVKMEKAFEAYVRQKAIAAGSTIIYAIDGQLVEENPKSLKKVVLKTVSYSRDD
jgi:hypothetical protein